MIKREGIDSLPRLKLCPQVVRKMLLETHKWTGSKVPQDGIVDVVAEPDRPKMDSRMLGRKRRKKTT